MTAPHDRAEVAARWPGALAGALGAAASLAVLEIVALLDATGTSVAEAVGNEFIDSFAASLKDLAVALFGVNDKAALQIGIAVVAMAIGAVLGRQAERRPNLVVAGFTAFGVLGVVVAATDPLASLGVAVVGCILAAFVGMAVTIGLERRWRRVAGEAHQDPLAGTAVARRTVLVNGGVMAVGLVFAVAVARSVRESLRASVTAVSRALPRPVRAIEVPPATLDAEVTGISPYVTPTEDFYRIDTAQRVPVVETSDWTLTIGGMVERELTFTYDELLARDLVEVPITMLCVSNEVGGSLVGTARWIGIPLAELLDEAGVQPGAEQVMGESVDGFTAGFPLEVALDGRDALLAVGMNGRSLPAEHGFPARLVVPGIYGYVSATKWIKEIRLTTWAEEGYWVPKGWSRLGPVKTSSRIDVPSSSARLAPGDQMIAGVAWAPHTGIERVEVQVDEGPWTQADLGPVASTDTWVQWRLTWKADPGKHQIRVRATDASGETQTAERSRVDPDGATGHHTIPVRVED